MKLLVTTCSVMLLAASPSFSQDRDGHWDFIYRLEPIPGKHVKSDPLEYSPEELGTWIHSWGRVRCNGRHRCTTRRN
jgi:hypothetical protein